MKKTEFEPRFVAAAESELGRDGEIKRPRLAFQFRRCYIEPCELNPVHCDDFHTEDGLTRQAWLPRSAAKIQPVVTAGQLPIGSEKEATWRFSAAYGCRSPALADPDRTFLEPAEHAPLTSRWLFWIGNFRCEVGSRKHRGSLF